MKAVWYGGESVPEGPRGWVLKYGGASRCTERRAGTQCARGGSRRLGCEPSARKTRAGGSKRPTMYPADRAAKRRCGREPSMRGSERGVGEESRDAAEDAYGCYKARWSGVGTAGPQASRGWLAAVDRSVIACEESDSHEGACRHCPVNDDGRDGCCSGTVSRGERTVLVTGGAGVSALLRDPARQSGAARSDR